MSEFPWLDDMVADVGVREIKGAKANEKILAYFAEVGHPECKSDEIAWCAARIGAALKRYRYPIPPVNVNLMARSYLTWGIACEPKPGAIVVFPRGNNTWQGHVGVVVEVNGDKVKYVAGNQSDSVAYGTAGISAALGYRWPVAATVDDLRNAGSTTIKRADTKEKLGIIAVFFTPIVEGIKSLFGPIDVPEFTSLPEGLTWWQSVLGGVNGIYGYAASHPILAASVIAGLGLWALSRWDKASRVAEHAAGVPIAAEVAKLEAA